MAKSDVLVRMKADTQGYDANIAKARRQLDQFKKDNLSAGGAIKQLSGNLISTGAKFASWGAAAAAAMKVAKDAFFNNEQMLDEWGRTVESCESIYKGFLNSINTGDISGFLNNIQTITQAARDAYDALDELATFNAFNKANIAGARAGLTGSIADFREGTGSREAVKAASEDLIKELETRQKLQAEAYKKVIAKVATERGVKPDDLMAVMTGKWGSFKELKELEYTGRRTRIVSAGGTYASGPIMHSITEAIPANERERLAQAVKHLNDTEIDNFQSLAEAAQMTEVEINNQRKMVARVLNGRNGGSGAGGGRGGSATELTEEQLNTKKIQEYSHEYERASAERKEWLLQEIKVLQQRNAEIKYYQDLATGKKVLPMGPDTVMEGQGVGLNTIGVIQKDVQDALKQPIDISGFTTPLEQMQEELEKLIELRDNAMSAEGWQAGNKAVQRKQKEIDQYKGDDGTKDVNAAQEIGKMAGGISSMVSGIESLGVEIPQGMKDMLGGIQGIVTLLSGISTILTAIEAISAADSIIPFAHGGVVHAAGGWSGMVPGNSFSGDNIPAMLDSGELVLNKFQQQALAANLQNNNGGGMRVVGEIQGEKIVMVANRFLKRSGQGELVTWK